MLDPLLDEYLIWLEHNKGRAVSTVNSYRCYLQRLQVHLNDHDAELATADRRLLEAFVGPVAHQANITLSGRKPIVAAVRNFYQWAEKNNKLTNDPAKHISYPRIGRALPTPISLRNAEVILNAPDLKTFTGIRDSALLAVLIGSGMRVSGLASLTTRSLEFEHYNDGKPSKLTIRVTEKGKKERLIPMPSVAVYYLLQYMTAPEFVALEPVLRLPNNDYILWVQTNRGNCPKYDWYGEKRRLSANGIRDIIKRHGKRSGIPTEQLHPHAFRHLYGTEMAENDIDPQRIQILMGHSSAESTNIYKHLAARKLAETVEKASPLNGLNTPFRDLHQKIHRANLLPPKKP